VFLHLVSSVYSVGLPVAVVGDGFMLSLCWSHLCACVALLNFLQRRRNTPKPPGWGASRRWKGPIW